MAQTFRKKPVEIEAMQFNISDGPSKTMDVYQWVERHIGSVDPYGDKPGVTIDPADGAFVIKTLEGDMKVSDGDWIIRGVQGEFYPCKPDIFEATYDQPQRVSATAGADAAHEAAVARFFTASEHEDVVALRDLIVALGAEIDRRVPAGRNKALALTALEDVQMRGNRGIFAPEGIR